MSRYFFNLAGEPPVDDPEGKELPNIETVRRHAVAVAHALMRRTKIFREDQSRWAVQVTDVEGHEVLTVPFCEASVMAVDDMRTNGAAFEGQLGWKIQLHIGKQMATAYSAILDEELPDRLDALLEKLRDASGATESTKTKK
jgi:hypothetical protein